MFMKEGGHLAGHDSYDADGRESALRETVGCFSKVENLYGTRTGRGTTIKTRVCQLCVGWHTLVMICV